MNRTQILELTNSPDPDAQDLGRRYAETYHCAIIDVMNLVSKGTSIDGIAQLNIPIPDCGQPKKQLEFCKSCGFKLTPQSFIEECNSCYYRKIKGKKVVDQLVTGITSEPLVNKEGI